LIPNRLIRNDCLSKDVHQLCDNDKNYMQVVKHIGSLVYSASEAIEHHSFDQLATIFNQLFCRDSPSMFLSHLDID
jgi:mevalonate kinase